MYRSTYLFIFTSISPHRRPVGPVMAFLSKATIYFAIKSVQSDALLTSHTSHYLRHIPSHYLRQTTYVTLLTSHYLRHTSYVTFLTSHYLRHTTSHYLRHTTYVTLLTYVLPLMHNNNCNTETLLDNIDVIDKK